MKIADLFASLRIAPDKKSLSGADKILGTVKKALVGLVAVKTVQYFRGMIADVSAVADRYAKMSQQVGVSVAALQQLEFAAGIGGASAAQLQTGLKILSRNLFDLSQGTGEAKDSFRELGVEFKKQNGDLRGTDQVLLDIAEAFSTMPDGAEKTGIAMKVFGKSGAELIPFLNQGKKGIAELRAEFSELGAEIDGETAAAFEQLNDDQFRLKTALTGLKNQAVIALLPMLKESAESTIKWVKANREMIAQKLATFLKTLVTVLVLLGKALGIVLGIIKFLTDHVEFLLIALGALAIAFTATGDASVVAGRKAMLAWVKAAAPIALIAAAALAAALIIEDLWQAFTGGNSVLKDLHGALVDLFVEAIEFWVAKWEGFVEGIKKGVNDVIALLTGLDPRATGTAGRAASTVATHASARQSEQVSGEEQFQDLFVGLSAVNDALKVPADFSDTFRRGAASFQKTLEGVPGGVGGVQATLQNPASNVAPTMPTPPPNVKVQSQVTVHAQTGASPEEIGRIVDEKQIETFARVSREVAASTEGG